MTCGEGIESAWAEQNYAAGSTKGQSTGHRQDTLDDFNAYWNWTKLLRLCKLNYFRGYHILIYLAKYLLTQFNKYWEELKELNVDFKHLSSRFHPNIINKWEEMGSRPFLGRDGKPRSLYQVNSAQGRWICLKLPAYIYSIVPNQFRRSALNLSASLM